MITDYKVGDITSGGDEISHIYGCDEKVIVFTNPEGELRWEAICNKEVFSKAVNKFHCLDGKIPLGLPDEIQKSINSEIASSLHHAFSSNNADDIEGFFENAEKRVLSLLSPNQAKLWLILYGLSSSIVLVFLLFITFKVFGP